MNFARPDLLYLIALLPVAVAAILWDARRRRDDLRKIGNPGLVARLSAAINHTGRRIRIGLWLAALALIVVAMARPMWGSQVETVEQQGSQVMVALDISTSMLAEDIRPNRLGRAKLEIAEIMQRLNGDEIGLVLFSGAAFIQFPLTFDYGTARSFLQDAEPSMISRQGTAIADAIRISLRGFDDQRPSQKAVIVITDGEDHEGDPVAAAAVAAADGIIVHTVGMGSLQGGPIPEPGTSNGSTRYKRDRNGQTVVSRLDEETLQQIAEAGNGQYFRTLGDRSAGSAIVDAIERLEKATIESEIATTRIERFQIFLAAALVALVAFELIPDRVGSTALLSRLRGSRSS
jgi:Ca-activated chloride channel family protein